MNKGVEQCLCRQSNRLETLILKGCREISEITSSMKKVN